MGCEDDEMTGRQVALAGAPSGQSACSPYAYPTASRISFSQAASLLKWVMLEIESNFAAGRVASCLRGTCTPAEPFCGKSQSRHGSPLLKAQYFRVALLNASVIRPV